jgi:hypothetical protein
LSFAKPFGRHSLLFLPIALRGKVAAPLDSCVSNGEVSSIDRVKCHWRYTKAQPHVLAPSSLIARSATRGKETRAQTDGMLRTPHLQKNAHERDVMLCMG